MNFQRNPVYKRSELKYLTSFRNKNQTRFNIKMDFGVEQPKSKMDKICLNKGEPSSKAKYDI